eukprot:Skav211829  [mRNA]  locus=scaffold305:628957:629649:- [translate_table: standard]
MEVALRVPVPCRSARAVPEVRKADALRPGGAGAVRSFGGGAFVTASLTTRRRPRRPRRAWPEKWDQLRQFAEMGQGAEAEELFTELFPKLPKNQQKKPFPWNLVLAAYSHSGDYDESLRWWNQTRKAGVPATKKAFGKMMEAAARSQRPDLAKEWMEKLTRELGEGVDPEVISIMIYAYAKDGNVDSAFEILQEKVRSGQANLIDYNAVADAYAKRGGSKDVAMAPRKKS